MAAHFGVVPKIMWSRKVAADERITSPPASTRCSSAPASKPCWSKPAWATNFPSAWSSSTASPRSCSTNLAAGGIAPEDIDIVINTHLHFDHCGWNTVRDKDGKIVPTFPRAKYYAPEGEWQYARNPSERDAISYIPENYDPLVESGQMTLLKGGEEIVPGISVKTFPGHTAHMQAVIVAERRPHRLLHLRPDPHHRAHRHHLGHGLRPLSAANHREQEAVLRARRSRKNG